jgi:hypothetical protein
MSTYNKITKHPQTGIYEIATWRDDYYGPHLYGVEFKSDNKVYPSELVMSKEVRNLWYEDVIEAFKIMMLSDNPDVGNNDVVDFLNQIQQQYITRTDK